MSSYCQEKLVKPRDKEKENQRYRLIQKILNLNQSSLECNYTSTSVHQTIVRVYEQKAHGLQSIGVGNNSIFDDLAKKFEAYKPDFY